MKIRSLATALIWVAACSCASSAFAGTASALPDDDSNAVFGSAKVSNLQDIGGRAQLGAPSALVGTDTLRGARGNIGVNLAAGALNAQANEIALITTPQAEISTRQNVHVVAQLSGNATAQLGAGALTSSSGNVGVNIAAGIGNAQFNGMIIH